MLSTSFIIFITSTARRGAGLFGHPIYYILTAKISLPFITCKERFDNEGVTTKAKRLLTYCY